MGHAVWLAGEANQLGFAPQLLQSYKNLFTLLDLAVQDLFVVDDQSGVLALAIYFSGGLPPVVVKIFPARCKAIDGRAWVVDLTRTPTHSSVSKTYVESPNGKSELPLWPLSLGRATPRIAP